MNADILHSPRDHLSCLSCNILVILSPSFYFFKIYPVKFLTMELYNPQCLFSITKVFDAAMREAQREIYYFILQVNCIFIGQLSFILGSSTLLG